VEAKNPKLPPSRYKVITDATDVNRESAPTVSLHGVGSQTESYLDLVPIVQKQKLLADSTIKRVLLIPLNLDRQIWRSLPK
jgi:hypothetical protein